MTSPTGFLLHEHRRTTNWCSRTLCAGQPIGRHEEEYVRSTNIFLSAVLGIGALGRSDA
jgi:hypothetical protein